MAIIKRKIENLKPGKEYIVTARAKNADVNVVSNYTDTIRFRVPVDTTIPEEIFNLKLYQSVENVMFVFDNVSDKDILTYEYELYSDISGTQLVSTGYNDASVFTVAVDNLQTDVEGEGLVPYWGKVRAIDTSNNRGEWTPLAKTDERVPLIDNQFIGSLTASKITAGSIGAHEIILTQAGPQTTITTPAGNAVLRSSNYDGNYDSVTGTWSTATSGWIITGDGRAEFNDAVIRGKLSSISLDVGTGDQSFHIDEQGNIWSGSQTFNTANFSVTAGGVVRIRDGSIDIGEGRNSFHVDRGARLWMGADLYEDGRLRIEPWGEVYINAGLSVGGDQGSFGWPAYFAGAVGIEGGLYVKGPFDNTMENGLRIGSHLTENIPLIMLSTGGLGSYFKGPFGNTKMLVRRTADEYVNIGDGWDRQSYWHNQIIQVINESASESNLGNFGGTSTVSGIAFGVGKLATDQVPYNRVYGCTLRCYPGSGGSAVSPREDREWISGLTDHPTRPGLLVESLLSGELKGGVDENEPYNAFVGSANPLSITGAGWNGLDVGNYLGDGYGYIGAASFVIRSSKLIKENIEYMPTESRSISIERIKNLKPARWDDKAKLTYGQLSEKFIEIDRKWQEKGRKPLRPVGKYYDTVQHDCLTENCIGNEFKGCPEVESQKKRYGFIAEDVAEIFPKAVQFSTLGQPMGIDYSVITYSLVETTQHLLDKIDQLEAKISELTAENNS